MARRGGIRVIAGSARGLVLSGPPGAGTRPTASRLRESLFAMLESAGCDFSRVLDLYAGTGALGIEALSRGTGRCTFVEGDGRACEVVRSNLARAGFSDRGEVARARVGRWRPPPESSFTLVVADPPYNRAAEAWGEIEHTVDGALAAHAMLAVEHATRIHAPAALAARAMWRDRRQGEGAVALYRPIGDDDAGGRDAE